jgi:uncharacterized protein (TIGR02598 family)
VEVVVAIGIFAFCIVALVGLMQVALSSSRDSQVDSSMAGLISNLSANLNALEPNELQNVAGSEHFFDLAGVPVASGAEDSVHFRARLEAVDPSVLDGAFSLPAGTNLRAWVVSVEYPAPEYARSSRFLLGRRSWR